MENDYNDYIVGRNPVLESLKNNREVEKILISKGQLKGSVNKIVGMAKDKRIPIQYVDKKRLDTISKGNTHQGVAALVTPYTYASIDDILNKAKSLEEDPFIIVLDEIEDPHNLGSIIRTAECGGVHGIIIPKRRSATVTQTVVKSSAGAVEHMLIAKVTNITDTLKELKEKGLWVYGADIEGEEYYFQRDFNGPKVLVIGNEGKGISRLVKENCDFLMKIPMLGKISSLNASNAASILIYEVVRERYGK
ncbi:MAG: 23S rRNA (guanosine(2251)-2'-O)-methyltransferase RlmB [Clostridiaceae bacterium]|nr:23S rRNA (guanosine(2251)-2'-O)-methyltransferase RlmB [Clostridiaceae bacterium]MBW4860646.1 23S rRNA (guanosine(2251)-2'-O)-methyltransferase RlmB [Clostridiaceae bacterium]MBW4869316.1 23S rRNA (guanosine(2251)-2'-O)-methyltransferase RlmB [Clostridiaceae bacterium]